MSEYLSVASCVRVRVFVLVDMRLLRACICVWLCAQEWRRHLNARVNHVLLFLVDPVARPIRPKMRPHALHDGGDGLLICMHVVELEIMAAAAAVVASEASRL